MSEKDRKWTLKFKTFAFQRTQLKKEKGDLKMVAMRRAKDRGVGGS